LFQIQLQKNMIILFNHNVKDRLREFLSIFDGNSLFVLWKFFSYSFSRSIYEPNPLPTKMICDYSNKVLVVLYDPMFGPLMGYMGNKRHFKIFFTELNEMKCKHIHYKIKHFVKYLKNAKNIKKKYSILENIFLWITKLWINNKVSSSIFFLVFRK
jgi:hypothetical protein